MRSHWIRWSLPVVVLAIVGVGVAMGATTGSSGATVKSSSTSKYGTVLVNSSGMTLYRFTPDSKGINTCTRVAACNKAWPRLLVKAGATPKVGSGASTALVGSLKQPKGLTQVSYSGFPLYLFSGDKKAGDTNGEGLEGKWYVVNVKGGLVKHAVAAASTTMPTTPTTSTASAVPGY
jgi:predicted lipoprotein with Yx(FWY)xxD motif